jgi:hypothetical protein
MLFAVAYIFAKAHLPGFQCQKTLLIMFISYTLNKVENSFLFQKKRKMAFIMMAKHLFRLCVVRCNSLPLSSGSLHLNW